jgi:hypothetical protein
MGCSKQSKFFFVSFNVELTDEQAEKEFIVAP